MTPKQAEVLKAVAKLNPDGTPLDIDQLIEAVDYEVTKPSIQFTIRSLIGKEYFIKKNITRRGRRRVVYIPQEKGLEVYRDLILPEVDSSDSSSGESMKFPLPP